jgi:hypothetical protein
MDMDHIKAVFFGPSLPFVNVILHAVAHSMMEAMWTYQVHLCAYN